MVRLDRSHLLRAIALASIAVAVSHGASAQSTNPIKLMKGIVTDARSGKPIDGGKLTVYAAGRQEPVAQSRINPATGAFQVVLGPSADYRFVVESPRFLRGETSVRTPGGNAYEEVVQNLTVEPIPVGRTLYSGRAFDAGASLVKPSPELSAAIAFLTDVQAATITVTVVPDAGAAAKGATTAAKGKKGKKGATATRAGEPTTATPPAADNAAALAQARAQALKALFQKEGVSLTRITWVVPQSAAEARSMTLGHDNTRIQITGIDIEEVE
jgi:hypothetical protein